MMPTQRYRVILTGVLKALAKLYQALGTLASDHEKVVAAQKGKKKDGSRAKVLGHQGYIPSEAELRWSNSSHGLRPASTQPMSSGACA